MVIVVVVVVFVVDGSVCLPTRCLWAASQQCLRLCCRVYRSCLPRQCATPSHHYLQLIEGLPANFTYSMIWRLARHYLNVRSLHLHCSTRPPREAVASPGDFSFILLHGGVSSLADPWSPQCSKLLLLLALDRDRKKIIKKIKK